MTNLEKITTTQEALGMFLKSLDIADGPWDAEFQKRYCSDCNMADCEGGSGCPHEEQRNNPTWWLGLEAKNDAGV